MVTVEEFEEYRERQKQSALVLSERKELVDAWRNRDWKVLCGFGVFLGLLFYSLYIVVTLLFE